jgi:TRAP transporter 4TM/12TM fusion protein
MAENPGSGEPEINQEDLSKTLEQIEYTGRKVEPRTAVTLGAICALWSVFQLWIASPLPYTFGIGIITDVPARGVHLAFAFLLAFLLYPLVRRRATGKIPVYDLLLALIAAGCALYVFLGYDGMVKRQGVLLDIPLSLFGQRFQIPVEALIGGVGIVALLEATRRAIGLPLVIVASAFLIFSIFGQSMPDVIAHKGLSLNRLIGYQWLSGEAIFGIPIDVSVSFVFLFVLFGAMLDRAGAGKYFLNLAFAMVGRFRGGPAKAAILASGMTGLISGSSIANVVTTGTFTIPVMKRLGMPAVKAGAIEVAASTNGQMMPPIMGAAAFIMAEFIGISYFDVIVAAFIPAMLAYIALFYISHLEALKLGLVGLPKVEIPPLRQTFVGGLHYLIPIFILIYLLMVERWTAGSAVFYSIIATMVVLVVERMWHAWRAGEVKLAQAAKEGFVEIYDGLVGGARNMIGIAVAVAAAGIIVGAVSSTGLNNALIGVVEAISGGNVYILLGLTAVLCLLLGMGLPTTANYIVVASLLAGVVVEIGGAAGLVLPLIAVHLFVFYYGLLADSTPPVCLAAFAASAISRADPLKTGVQSFLYDIRTGILPFVFIFNTELLLIGVDSVWHALLVFMCSLLAILAFSSLTQWWFVIKLKWFEGLILVVAIVALFRPGYVMNQFYPEYEQAPVVQFAAGEAVAPPGYTVRFHVVRSTDYGDRFKLFRVGTPELIGADNFERYGIRLTPGKDGRFQVSDLKADGLTSQAGLEMNDFVVEIDVQRVGVPDKEWIYPVGLLLLLFVVGTQYRRRRLQNTGAPAAGA